MAGIEGGQGAGPFLGLKSSAFLCHLKQSLVGPIIALKAISFVNLRL